MNAPLAKEQIALLMSDNASYRMAPAYEPSYTAPSRPGLLARLADAVRHVATYPQRRAVYDELSRLTDRELTDIGLLRSELRQVYARAR